MSDEQPRRPGRPLKAVTKRPRRAKGAAPRKPAKIEKNVKYVLQLSEPEKTRLETLAQAKGFTLGELIRQILAAYQ